MGRTGVLKTREFGTGGVNDGEQRNKIIRQGVGLESAGDGFVCSDVGRIRDVVGGLHSTRRLLVAGS